MKREPFEYRKAPLFNRKYSVCELSKLIRQSDELRYAERFSADERVEPETGEQGGEILLRDAEGRIQAVDERLPALSESRADYLKEEFFVAQTFGLRTLDHRYDG